MDGFVVALCIVSSIFNLVMFIACVRARNQCIDVLGEVLNKFVKSVKSVDDALNDAKEHIDESVREFINETGDRDCKRENS